MLRAFVGSTMSTVATTMSENHPTEMVANAHSHCAGFRDCGSDRLFEARPHEVIPRSETRSYRHQLVGHDDGIVWTDG